MPTPEKTRKRKRKRRFATAPRLIRVRPAGSKKKTPPSSEAASSPAVYIVLEHSGDYKPFYSVIEAAAGAAARPIQDVTSGMSFAAVESTRRGPRIVGVGLNSATVFDPNTSREIAAPRLVYPKLSPVLIAHGSKLYALSRVPSVVMGVDFMPWFFVLNLDDSYATTGTVRGTRWLRLPPPPVFPCRLNPLEYRDPPEHRVAAYAVVGDHILLSVSVHQQPDKQGTCAFDVDAKEWHMVDDKNLPFVGEAVPLGDRRFLACAKAKGGAPTVYYMEMEVVFSPGRSSCCTILELAVASKDGIVPGQLLCSMGKNGGFSSFDVSDDPKTDDDAKRRRDKARIVHRIYSEVLDAETKSVVVALQQEHVYKLRDPYDHLDRPTRVVAAVTM